MNHRPISLTIDANRINAKGNLPGMLILERWEREERVVFIAARRLLGEARYSDAAKEKTRVMKATGEPFVIGMSAVDSDAYWSDSKTPDFISVASVVFPKSLHSLDKQSENDVMHLLAHEAANGGIFITADKAMLNAAPILQSRWGIVVMTDDDAVAHLRATYGWT